MFGYYDNTGYPNMYTGPTNGGVFPMNNSAWGTTVINGESRALCPLSATRFGDDERSTRGHVDDYWVSYGSSSPDPYIGHWTEHTQGTARLTIWGPTNLRLEAPTGLRGFSITLMGAPFLT